MSLHLILLSIVLLHAEGRPSLESHQEPYMWTEWEYCPETSHSVSLLTGFSLIYKETDVLERRRRSVTELVVAWGVNMACAYVDPSEDEFTTSVFPPGNQNFTGNYAPDPERTCESPEEEAEEYATEPQKRLYSFVVGIEKGFSTKVKRLAEVNTFCNYEEKMTQVVTLGPNAGELDVRWEPQSFCSWGKYACGIKLRYDVESHELEDVKVDCCKLLSKELGWKNYRGETSGRVVSSIPPVLDVDASTLDRQILGVHLSPQLDDPYYFEWEFCPRGTYVTGLQGQLTRRLFRLSCSDVSEPAPRVTEFIGTSLSKTQWEKDKELSKPVECEGGVVIGMQVLYGAKSRDIQGLRLLCSHSMEDPEELPYVKVLLPAVKDETEIVWGEVQMCRRGEAVCGWKPNEVIDVRTNVPIKTNHVKVKCCHVPPMAEICAPHDAFELLLQCDARQARAETTCQYTLTEGFTVSTTSSEHHSRSNNLRNALNEEWNFAEVSTLRQSVDLGTSTSTGESDGVTGTHSKTNSASFSNATTDGRSSSSSVGFTDSSSSSANKGDTWTRNVNRAFDQNTANSHSSTSSDTLGISGSFADNRMTGQSENFLHTRSRGRGFSDSTSDVVGSSTGSMASSTASRGQSSSAGRTRGRSESDTSTDEKSVSVGVSGRVTAGLTTGVEAEAGFQAYVASASVKKSFQASFSAEVGTSGDTSFRDTKTRSKETTDSETSQQTNEENKSNTAQDTKESQSSQTKGKASETNEQDTHATGGDLSNQQSVTITREKNSAATKGVGSESSASKTNRTEESESSQGSTQVTNEQGSSTVRQKGQDVSRNREVRIMREDSDMASIARMKEATFSQTGTFSRSEGREGSQTRGGGKVRQREKQFTTGFDWTKTSESTWRTDRSYEVRMTVPPGYKSQLFQAVGYCGHFQVRTNNYKRIDELAEWKKEEEEKEKEAGPPTDLLQRRTQDSSHST